MEDFEELPTGTPLYVNLSAGALAGVMEHAICYPLDSIKTRMQVIESKVVYTSVSNAFRTIATNEGARNLWKGMSSVILGAGPSHAIFYGSYELAKKTIDPKETNSVYTTALSGALATLAADAFLNPFDVVKQRMQLQHSPYRSVFQCAQHIWMKEGMNSFYVSYPTTLFLNIPFHAIQFTVYEKVKEAINPSKEQSVKAHLISGATAGGVAAALTNPIDMIKTLLQTRGSASDPEIRKASGALDAIKIIYRQQGAAGFFKGVQPRVASHVPSTAICWTVYEYFKWYLNNA